MHTALIVAAGSGSRSQLNVSKVLYKVNHKPIFLFSVETFLNLGYQVILVVSKNDFEDISSYVDDRVKIVLGGKTRSESVRLGLAEVVTPYVYIHDAARPMIQPELIKQTEKALELHDAVFLAEPMTSALKSYVNGSINSADRSQYLLAQTPQAFLTEKIRYAYIRTTEHFDDDISLYQAFYKDADVEVIVTNEPNPKLTYPEDFKAFKQLKESQLTWRIGHSFDLHRLSEDRKLILGGLQIEHTKGLLGHSDADVLLHAISEAMLGALALGDLGTHFPDTDPKYKDLDSKEILKKANHLIKEQGYLIHNIDATVYAELPKLNPYIIDIRTHIAHLLDIEIEQVSIKATTYEGLDAIGRQEAMAAEAIVLLERIPS